jgi:hypothetical protein
VKYLILMTDAGATWDRLTPAERDEVLRRHDEATKALEAQQKLVSAVRLRPASEAVTVRRGDDGQFLTFDGPFAETKEVVGGYYVVECATMTEAVEWGRRLRFLPGANEVRPVWE